jgi:tRNA acetyltransferase TAN1
VESRSEKLTDISLPLAVVFFKTVAPVEPVSFIHKICEDAMAEPMRKRTRTAKRLAPMTLMGKATMEGLESVARDVLAPHFHQAPVTPKKVSE